MDRRLYTALLAWLTMSLCAALVVADTPAINSQSLELTAAADDALSTRSARRQADGSWHFAGALHYCRDPLVFSHLDAAGERLQQSVLGDLWMTDLGFSYGLGPWLFEAIYPIAWYIRGGGPNLVGVQTPHAPTSGDLRLGVRRHLWQRSLDTVGEIDIGATVGSALGSAGAGNWLGSGGVQFDLGAIASWRRSPWRADFDVLLRYRPRQALVVVSSGAVDKATGEASEDRTEDVLVTGSELRMQAAVGRSLLEGRLGVALETQLRFPLGSDATAGQQLVDTRLAVDHPISDGLWRVFGALGTSLSSSYGASSVRFVVGARLDPSRFASDRDGDGIDDRVDRCKDRPEDLDGYEDEDGCPEPDNDGDGLADADDRCPLEAEDKDGHQDNDGCPDPDNDGDGVLDGSDKCPAKPEDKDGFDDRDGCPEADNDGDGIADGDDLCPAAAENRNNFEDQDGCPDQDPPPAVERRQDHIVVARPIAFVRGQSALSPAGRAALDLVLVWLRDHKKISALEVAGHTDNNGEPEALRELSQLRAAVVKAYLILRGTLESHQIRAIGYGAQHPISTNQTLQGRSRNRRIELIVIGAAAVNKPRGEAAKPAVQKKRKSKRKRKRRRKRRRR